MVGSGFSFLPVRGNKSVLMIDLSAYDAQVPFLASVEKINPGFDRH